MIFKVNNKKLSNALYLQKRQNRELKEKLEKMFLQKINFRPLEQKNSENVQTKL
jgi:tRNA G18 (ribose-2'-O)-methylase SpoU